MQIFLTVKTQCFVPNAHHVVFACGYSVTKHLCGSAHSAEFCVGSFLMSAD